MDRSKELINKSKEFLLPAYRMFQDNRITVYSGYATLFIVTALIPFMGVYPKVFPLFEKRSME